jgi:threonine/homoserine/homoserine lactone efflux protein
VVVRGVARGHNLSVIELPTLGVFALAALGLLVVPGPAVIYITTRSIDQGRSAGLVSVLGISAGTLVHTAAAALGLSALLTSSGLAFTVVKLVGAAYLIYLGVRRMLQPETVGDDVRLPRQPLWRIFRQGVLVNVLNPKTALFMFAFLPQFVDPARGPVELQILLLGAVLALLGLLSDGAYALLAARFGRWLRTSPRFASSQRYVSGGILVGLGVSAAFTSARK